MSKISVPGGELYERGILKLTDKVKRVYAAERASGDQKWNRTAQRKEIEEIAKKLEDAAEILTSCSAQFDLEVFHDKRGLPEEVIGIDGWPEPQEDSDWPIYQSIKWDIRLLAESARLCAESVPNSRRKFALEFAARGLLHLRFDYEFPPPVKYKDSDDVFELERVCINAGMMLSRESYLNAITKVLKTFDPRYTEPEFYFLYQ